MTSRRQFLRVAGSAGLVLAFDLGDAAAHVQTPQAIGALEPNAHLRVAPDGTVTLWVTRLEMGQGVRTLLPMILAEELEADWGRVRIEQASPGSQFKGIELHTSGSGSSSASYRQLRVAAAAAREMLIAAAASSWSVEASSCHAERGAVIHGATGRRAGYGQLASDAAKQLVPAQPVLKDPARF